jgi:hypothetical protein
VILRSLTVVPRMQASSSLEGNELGQNRGVSANPGLKTRAWFFIGSALFAAALVWLPLGRWLPMGSRGEMRLSLLEYVFLPALVPAVLLARAVHGVGDRVGDLLIWIGVTLQTYAMVSLVAMLVRRALRGAHRT